MKHIYALFKLIIGNNIFEIRFFNHFYTNHQKLRTMKKTFVLFSLCALILASIPTFAQNAPNGEPTCNKENHPCTHQCHQPQILTPASIAMLKEEFFKENLKLNDNQKDAFWKAYNKYEKAKKQAMENTKANMEKAGLPSHHGCKDHGNAKLTDEQKVAMYRIQLENRQAMLTAEQNFFNEISKTLSNEQIAQYLDLEKLFNMELHKLNAAQHADCNHHQTHGDRHPGNGPRPECHKSDMQSETPQKDAPHKVCPKQ